MVINGELYYLARDGEPGELNARTPSRTDLFTKKTVSIADGRELVPAPVDEYLQKKAQFCIGMNAVLFVKVDQETVRVVQVAREAAVSATPHMDLLDRCGLTFMTVGTAASLDALRDPTRVMSTGYFQETERMLLSRLPGIAYAFAFNYVNRQSDLIVHTLPANDKSARGPVNDVHSDYTAESFVIKALAERQEKLGLSGARCMILNVWRPLCDPGERVSSWPLTVCDASSVRTPPQNLVLQHCKHTACA